MADIKYASIINSFVSQEGFGGNYTNYIYYSVLVVYTDGSRTIIEGKNNEIQFLLPYLRTPVDELQQLNRVLEAIEKTSDDKDRLFSRMVDIIATNQRNMPIKEKESSTSDKWRCSKCGRINDNYVIICKCGARNT